MFIPLVVAVAFLSFPDSLAHSLSLRTGQVHTQSQSAELAEASELEKTVVKLYGEGKFQEALPLAIRVLQIRERVGKADIQSVRSASFNLAEVYLALGKYGEAESSFERVIESYKRFHPNDVRLADVLERMALVHFARNNNTKAEGAHQEALRLKEGILGAESPATMRSLMELAEFYQFIGAFAKSVPLYQRLLAFREKEKGPNQQEELAEVVDRYACALRRLNKRDAADNLEKTVFGSGAPAGDSSEERTLGNILNGRAIRLPKPNYPPEARAIGASGVVLVRIMIDENGNVVRACAIKGHKALLRTSERSAYGAKFTPTQLSGKPVKAVGVLTYKYVVW